LRFEAKAHQIKSVADLLKCQGRQIQFQSKSNAINLPLCHTQTITSTDSEVTDRPRDILPVVTVSYSLRERKGEMKEIGERKTTHTQGLGSWN